MFSRSPQLWAYAQGVIESFPEVFDHLGEARIAFLMAHEEMLRQGRHVLGYAAIPEARGREGKILTWALEQLFGFEPDAVVVIDAEYWEEVDDHRRISLVYHELRHIEQKETNGKPSFSKDDGRPVYRIKGHDVEEFTDVVRKFGEWERGLFFLHEAIHDEEGRVAVGPIMERVRHYLSADEGT